jgi:tetratricopeptide (TPR) repeat protein
MITLVYFGSDRTRTRPSLFTDGESPMNVPSFSSLKMFPMIAAFLLVALLTSKSIPAQASENQERSLSDALELERQKDFAGAERIYKEVLRQSADDPEILKRLGHVCQQQGKQNDAIEAFQRIVKRAPLYPGVNALLAISYYALNKFDKTIEASQQELTGNPKDKQARYYLSLALSASGRLFEAIQQLETLQRDDPENLAVMYQLVVDYKAAAQEASQRLARKAPNSEFTHALKAEVLADSDRFDQAIEEFQAVFRKNPDFPGIHLALGQLYWRRKDLEMSREELKLALVEDPNQPLANYYLADILVTDKEYLKAIPHLEITLSIYPELTRAYWLLGKCFVGSGNQPKAIEVFKKALDLDPNYKEVHFQLHELYARLGNKADSQEHLQIFERLTREDRNRAREDLEKQKR